MKHVLVFAAIVIVECAVRATSEHIIGTSETDIVTEYLGECTQQEQCEWLGENSLCQHYYCICKEGYRWYQGGCKKYVGIGKVCQQSLDCFDGYNPLALSCVEQKCACSEGYYPRNNLDCRKIAPKVGDLCALDIDCKFENGVCVVGRCEIKSDKIFTFNESSYYNRSVYTGEAKVCETNEECTIDHSECYEKTKTCTCKKGYFFNGDGSECIGEIGMNVDCKTDSDCKIKPGKCVEGVCYCRDYYFTADGNKECIKSMIETNWNCLTNQWCYAFGPHSYCDSVEETCKCSQLADFDENNHLCIKNREDPSICTFDLECQDQIRHSICSDESCQCKEDYREEDSKCMPDIGAICDEEFACTLDNTECEENVCRCVQNYVTADNSTCYRITDKLGGNCKIDEQCTATFSHSICTDGKCGCIDNYHEKLGLCFEEKELFSYCSNRLECTVFLGDTVTCRNNKCQCATGYTYNEDKCESSGRVNVGNYFLVTALFLLKGFFLWFG